MFATTVQLKYCSKISNFLMFDPSWAENFKFINIWSSCIFAAYFIRVNPVMNICVATGQCSAGEVCKALRQCVEAVELVRDAEQSEDPARTQHIIQLLRGKVCGKRSDRSICCSSGELNCQRLVEIQQTSKTLSRTTAAEFKHRR